MQPGESLGYAGNIGGGSGGDGSADADAATTIGRRAHLLDTTHS